MSKRQQIRASFIAKRTQPEFWLNCGLYVCLGLALLPITLWIANTAYEQSRILHALIVLVMAIFVLLFYNRIEIDDPLMLNKSARKALYAAYGLMLFSLIFQKLLPSPSVQLAQYSALLPIPAYCLGLTSLVLFVFGEQTRRIAYTATGTFCAFMLVSIFMGPLDWPLRSLAGKWSGAGLSALGKTVELGVHHPTASEPPQLIMIVNDFPFHVASECNGFGVILTCLLLSVLLAIYRKLNPLDAILNIAAGITLGFAFNTLRILIIVLLAPSMMEYYHFMHETVGGITYWSSLIITWILLKGPIHSEPNRTA
jgi:exosortase/archaeosortase family protein